MRGRLAARAARRASVLPAIRGSLVAWLLGSLVGLGLAGGCADPKLDRMTEVRNKVCACKDAACVEAALARMPAKSPRDEHRAQQVAREILTCVAQVGATPAPEAGQADEVDGAGAPPATPTPSPAEAPSPAAPPAK